MPRTVLVVDLAAFFRTTSHDHRSCTENAARRFTGSGGRSARHRVYRARLQRRARPSDPVQRLGCHDVRPRSSRLWIQQHAVVYVPDSPFARINAYPPMNTRALLTLILSGGDRYVGAVEFVALLATASETYGIGRWIGLDAGRAVRRLAFMTLPVVLLQSWTVLNDIVVALPCRGDVLPSGSTRVDLDLAGLALALAVGTRFTALIALPLVALVALVGSPDTDGSRSPSRPPPERRSAASGSSSTSSTRGASTQELRDALGQDPAVRPRRSARATARSRDLQTANVLGETSSSSGRRRQPFVVATAIDRPKARRPPSSPWAWPQSLRYPREMPTIGEALLRAHEKLWVTLGSRDLAFLEKNRDPHSPSTVFSTHGSLGFVSIVTGIGALSPRSAPRGGPARGARARSSPTRVRTLARDGRGVRPVPREVLHVPSRACGCDMGSFLPHRWLAGQGSQL